MYLPIFEIFSIYLRVRSGHSFHWFYHCSIIDRFLLTRKLPISYLIQLEDSCYKLYILLMSVICSLKLIQSHTLDLKISIIPNIVFLLVASRSAFGLTTYWGLKWVFGHRLGHYPTPYNLRCLLIMFSIFFFLQSWGSLFYYWRFHQHYRVRSWRNYWR